MDIQELKQIAEEMWQVCEDFDDLELSDAWSHRFKECSEFGIALGENPDYESQTSTFAESLRSITKSKKPQRYLSLTLSAILECRFDGGVASGQRLVVLVDKDGVRLKELQDAVL